MVASMKNQQTMLFHFLNVLVPTGFVLVGQKIIIMKKSAQRDANTARALAVVRFGHSPPAHPPARPLSQTHRQDRLQYTAQCNNKHKI